jgi:hypothetical protein
MKTVFEEVEKKVPNIQMKDISSVLKEYIPLLVDFLKSDDMIALKKEDENKFLDVLEDTVPNFANRFPFLLNKLADDPNDLSNLYFFLEKLDEQKSVNEKTQDVVNQMGDWRAKK